MKVVLKYFNIIIVAILIVTFSLALNAGEKVFCSLCFKEIESGYVKFKDNDIFCNECMKKPKCIQCGKPTDNILKGQHICSKCAEHPNMCRVCGKLLGRKYMIFPLSSGQFCRECVNKYPKCRFCSAPTTEHASFGRKFAMCPECKKRAVREVAEIKDILSEVENIILTSIKLSLKSPAALEVCGDIIREGRGMNGDEMGLMQQRGGTSVLLIQEGLPVEEVYETLAHEWAHAWVAQNAKYKLDLKNEEGFCQWVASKVLINKGFDENLNILRTRDDLYGVGYRKMEKIEMSRGTPGVIEFIENSKPGLFKKLFGKKR